MYFGSVRFYKHVILILMALVVIFSLVFGVSFCYTNYKIQAALEANGFVYEDGTIHEVVPTVSEMELMIGKERMAQYYIGTYPYQELYPELYIDNDFVFAKEQSKTVYLTFDDGPSALTPEVLDILKAKEVPATFFIIYDDSPEAQALYQRMLDEGHTIGVHSTSHKYDGIYQSVEAYLDDFATTALMLERVTGVKPEIFRFPGGSVNNYNRALHQQLVAEMVRRGYTYYDWNVSSGDASTNPTRAQIYSNVINGVQRHESSIVLMHDAGDKYKTVASLPLIIDELKAMGYTFASLNKDVKPVAFEYVH